MELKQILFQIKSFRCQSPLPNLGNAESKQNKWHVHESAENQTQLEFEIFLWMIFNIHKFATK